MGRSRDIANFLGKTELTNANNNALLHTASSIDAGLDSASVLNLVGTGLTVYATPNLLPTSGLTSGDQAFVTSNSRIYISNGSGWYNVALINSTPTFTTGPNATYSLSNDLTPTVITLLAQDSDGQVVTYSASDSGMTGIATLSQDSSVFTITPLTDSAGGNIGTFTITFQATDGIGIASELSTFTLSFGPDWSVAPTESIVRGSDLPNRQFGFSVSMSSDGNYAIVGSRLDDGGIFTGAAYIYTRSGSTWTLQQKIQASDKATFTFYGDAVSINSDGTYAIVGQKYNGGAAYIYTRSGSTWTEQQKIQASDFNTNHQFGIDVSINSDGTYVIVGDFYNDTPASDAGAAYIFTRSGSTWTQQQKIQASDAQASDQFGLNVSISDDATYAIVGAMTEDGGTGDPLTSAGAAYIFSRSGSTWTQQAKLTASDATAADIFGSSLAMSGDGNYVVINAGNENGGAGNPLTRAGATYIFIRSGSTWTEQAILRTSDSQAEDRVGESQHQAEINSDGTYVIVGTKNEDGGVGDPLTTAGAAYIFERDGTTWTEVKKLTASDAQANDEFGWSVAISGDGKHVVVGAYSEDGGAGDPHSGTGAAYFYEAG